MVTEDVGRVAEDYLALIWKANEWPGDERRATTSDLAAALGVTLSTVSANLKRLARERLIRYQPYGAIELTREGERIALGVVRRHRLIETFLVEQLCYSWDEVHEEADRLEHAVTDRLIERMDILLGFPATDPHGDPIPRLDVPGSVPARATRLSALGSGTDAAIVRVSDASPAILRFLSDRGIRLGTKLRVDTGMSATGLMTIAHGHDVLELSAPIAHAIYVAPSALP